MTFLDVQLANKEEQTKTQTLVLLNKQWTSQKRSLTQETKRYDVNGMHVDLNQKMDKAVTSIMKEEKIIMNDEERQLRNLEKLEHMSQYLTEDHILTQNSLKSA